MDLYHIDQKTADDDFQGICEQIPRITEKCVSIYERRRNLYFIDSYLRRLLDGDSYMKLDILEEQLRPIINKRYFPMPNLDRFLLGTLQARDVAMRDWDFVE